jgi:hypothetical protein
MKEHSLDEKIKVGERSKKPKIKKVDIIEP